MAACTSRLNAVGDTSNVPPYVSASHTPAAGELMVYFVEASGCTDAAPTLTDSLSEGTYTLLGHALYNTSLNSLYCFIGDQLAANSARTVSFSCSAATGATIGGIGISGMTLVGAAALAQALAKQENQAATGTPAPAFGSAANTNNPTLGGVGKTVNTGMTPPTSWNEMSDNGHATPNNRLESVVRDSGFTGTTITWGGTSDGAFSSIIIELDASAGGSIEEGDGSASGTGAASGIGASTAAAAAAASGTGAASGVGASIAAAAGSAAGTGAAAGIGASTAAAVGSAAGTGTASGVGAQDGISSADGSAAGTSTAAGVGASIAATVGAAAGTGAASAAGTGINSAAGSAAGAGAASGVGTATIAAIATAIGSSDAAAIGAAIWATIGAAAGVGSASAVSNAPTPRIWDGIASPRSATTPATPRP